MRWPAVCGRLCHPIYFQTCAVRVAGQGAWCRSDERRCSMASIYKHVAAGGLDVSCPPGAQRLWPERFGLLPFGRGTVAGLQLHLYGFGFQRGPGSAPERQPLGLLLQKPLPSLPPFSVHLRHYGDVQVEVDAWAA
jgi:hypothetical protein